MVVLQTPSSRAPALDKQCIEALQKRRDGLILCRVFPVKPERRGESDANEHFEVVRKTRDEREEFLRHPALLVLVFARPL